MRGKRIDKAYPFERWLYLLLVLIIAASSVSANSWHASVEGWSIDRRGMKLNMSLDENSHGTVSRIEVSPAGRTTGGYHSRYIDIGFQGIGLQERDYAREGQISTSEITFIRSDDNESVDYNATKAANDPFTYFHYFEKWPMILESESALEYEGWGMNEREVADNNLDQVRSTLNYNPILSHTRSLKSSLDRFNVTVTTDLDNVIGVNYQPTKRFAYESQTLSTGLGQLYYRQSAANSSLMHEGMQTFLGRFETNLRMGTVNIPVTKEEERDWIECCGWISEIGSGDGDRWEEYLADIPPRDLPLRT
ncbi:MAG: hypothetical protein JW986_03720 [Methanotrichaceae archaeon]|nr:hypothetical protein [Methanotrichaceae archaeon]